MRFCFAILCGLSLLASDATVSSAANLSDFIDFSSPSLPGRLYVPPQAATGPRPLIVFLHGSGEVGSDNQVQVTGQNINNLLLAAKNRGAYLYAPQTSIGWSSTTVMDRVMEMIDQAIVDENVDNRRLYATGLSLGGGGTWNLINRHSDRFAAAVPICAVGPTWGYSPANLAKVPIWAFHARTDMTVPCTVSEHDARPALHGVPHRRACHLGESIHHGSDAGMDVLSHACTGAECGGAHAHDGAGADWRWPPVRSETAISVMKPSGIVTIPG